MGIPFCCTAEHVQLNNVTVDVMNIIVTITVGEKCIPKCIKMRRGHRPHLHWRGD